MTRRGVSRHLEVLQVAEQIASTRRALQCIAFTGADQVDAPAAWLARLAETDTNTETERK